MNKAHQDGPDELLIQDETVKNLEQILLDSCEELRTLRTKYQDLKKHLTSLQKEQSTILQSPDYRGLP